MCRLIPTSLLITCLFLCFTLGYSLRIGALLEEDGEENVFVFRYGIDYLNNRSREFRGQPKLQPIYRTIDYGNEFEASTHACRIIESGVAAIFGPYSIDVSNYLESICDEKEIPLIQYTRNDNVEMPVVNLFPHPESLAEALLDIIEAYNWESFTILYESAQFLPRVSNLLKLYDSKGYTITVRQLSLQINNNYRAVLKRVKNSKDKNIVIDCSLVALPEVLKQAQQVGLMTDHHQFIVTNLDFHTIDLEPFKHSGTNITGIRIVDPNNPFVKEMTEKWGEHYLFKKQFNNEYKIDDQDDTNVEEDANYDIWGEGNDDDNDDDDNGYEAENNEQHNDDNFNQYGNPEDLEPNQEDGGDENNDEEELEIPMELTAEHLRSDTALIFDGLLLFIESIKQLRGLHNFKPVSLSCDTTDTWQNGYSVVNFMRTSTIRGLTNYIRFDREGRRRDFNLDIIELTSSGIIKVGEWNENKRIEILRSDTGMKGKIDSNSMKNVSLVVVTALVKPYGMLKKTSTTLMGNDRFEGFGIELIEKLAEQLGFNYTFTLQDDLDYGKKIEDSVTGEVTWSGMIGKLLDETADLAITDLTITADRETIVDFTNPFMNLGISILYKKATKQPPAFFSFMSPFSKEVWIYLGMGYLGVSLCLFILGRISPNEWDNPYPCIEEPEVLENQFSFRNAMWFAIGALLQQGTELAPKTPSTRTIASIWWFFTLIMVSSYTANLAAFLTVETPFSKINSATELADKNGEVKYGAKFGGSTYYFFRDSDNPTYKKMFKYMEKHRELQPESNDKGLENVENMDYAFLMESTSIEYMIERNCNVDQVGQPLDNKGYGIAMRKNYKYRNELSETVLRLQEQGKLTEMKTKWWKEKHGGGSCSEGSTGPAALPLGVDNVIGVFVLLILGGVAAFFISCCEFAIDIKKRSTELKSKADPDAGELNMENVGGVFLVLVVGSAGATIFGIFEWLCLIKKNANEAQIPFKQELLEELKFVLKCQGNTKTIRRAKSGSTDSRQSNASEIRSMSKSLRGDSVKDPYATKLNCQFDQNEP